MIVRTWQVRLCRLCCKTILRIRARKIDSRSCADVQRGFKNPFASIRLLRISILQPLRGDFCNTICQERP